MTDPGPDGGWQEKLDGEFPRGALCSWDYGRGGQAVVYQVPRIVVASESGGYPVVLLPVPGRLLGPWTVTSYERDSRGPGLRRVTFDGIEAPMTWSPRVPPQLARLMAAERSRLFREGIPE